MDNRIRALFPAPDYDQIVSRLQRPAGKRVDAILDTDTFCEIDDQFALAYMVRSPDKINLLGITAAPFHRRKEWGGVSRSSGPADGMEKSYHEILHMLTLLGAEELKPHVFRGALRYLDRDLQPVDSEAARWMVETSKAYTPENPLYIIAIGCMTNVASALLLDPAMSQRVVVCWLGGHGHHFGTCNDFNMIQDITAARVLMLSGTPVVQYPLFGVVSEFRFAAPELEYWLRDKNDLCNYLLDNTLVYAAEKFGYEGWSNPIWDVAVVSWIQDGDFFESRIEPGILPTYECTYESNPQIPIRYIYYIKKDALIRDITRRLYGEA